MRYTKAMLVLFLAFSVVCLFSMPQLTETETKWAGGPIGNASAVNDTILLEGINESIEQYVPLIVAFTLLGVALGALGIQMYRNR